MLNVITNLTEVKKKHNKAVKTKLPNNTIFRKKLTLVTLLSIPVKVMMKMKFLKYKFRCFMSKTALTILIAQMKNAKIPFAANFI